MTKIKEPLAEPIKSFADWDGDIADLIVTIDHDEFLAECRRNAATWDPALKCWKRPLRTD